CRDLLACPLRDLGITVSLQDRLQAALRCVQRAHIGLQLYNPAYVSANEADFLLDLGCLATDAYFSQLAEAGSDPGPAGLESAVVARIGRTIRLMRFTWRAARLLGNTVPDYERLIDNGDAAAVAYLAKLHGLPSSDWLRQLASLLLLVDNKNLGISGSTDTPKLLPLLVPALLTVDGLSVWRVAQLLLDAGLSELAARQNLDALLKAARVSLLELDDDSDIDSISDSNSDISSGLSALGELLTIACRLGGFGSALSLHRLHTCLRIIQSCRCCCCLAESGAVNSSDSAAQLGMALEVRYEDSAIMSLPSTQRLMFLKLTGQMMRLTERASDAAPAVAIDQTPSNATLINLASQAIDTLRLAGRPLAALTLATLLSELQDNTDSLGAADSLPSICQDRCHALLTGLLSQRLEAKLIDKQLCQSAAWSLPESVGQSVLRRVAQKSRHSYNRLEFIARLAYHYGAQRGNPEHAKRALALAKGAYWSRTLSALGIKIGDLTAPGKAAECAETLCSLPVSKSLQPDLLLYYCQQYQQPAAAHLLRYLENLLFPQSGSQVEVSQGAVNLAGATLAVLKRVSHPDELLNRLLGYYAQLDPYEYESIELICCSLLAMPQCPEAQAAHCSRALQLLASLKRYRRVSQISSYERNWYQKRMQRPDLAEWYFTSASAINSKSSRRLNLFALLEPKLYKIVLTSVYDSERALHVAFAMLKRTSLGWLKLRITRICLAVCQAWSETETTAAPPQPPATLQQQKLTGGAAQQSIHRAEASLKRYRDILEALECEQALHANGLSDCSDLAKLCSSPSELLNRLVSAGEAEAASQVAEILGADLSAVVAKRVQDWLGIKPAGSGADGS
uniref:Separase n=2 Tax=Macrostomum lignano TaxID=282301 RepID=A0A1I8J8X3_9PLAT